MQTLKGHKGQVRALAFAPGSNHLVSVAGHGSSISRWDLARGKRSYLSGLTGKPRQLLFSRTGDRLVARDDDGNVHVRDTRADDWPTTHLRHAKLVTLLGPAQALALMQMSYSGPNGLRIEEPAGERFVPLPWNSGLDGLAAAPDGTTLAVTLHRDNQTPLEAVAFLRPGNEPVLGELLALDAIPYAVAFSPDGATLSVATTKSIQRFATATGTRLPALKQHTRMVTGLAYLPDGRLLSCSFDGTVCTWDGDRCVDVKDWKLGRLTTVAVAPDGMRAAVGCYTGDIFLWDLD
jgi:WD40 repeat protein